MIVIAIDPGKMTGVASWNSDTGLDRDTYFPPGFSSFEVDVEEFREVLVAITRLSDDVQFVAESFIITAATAKNTQAPWSLEHIGAFKFVAAVWFHRGVTMQAPSIGKTFGTDAKLRHVGWFTKGKGHANDAARHLITYCASRGMVFSTDVMKELADV